MPATMTKKEVVKKAIAHKKTEQVPYYMKFSTEVYTRLQKHFITENVEEAVGNYIVTF